MSFRWAKAGLVTVHDGRTLSKALVSVCRWVTAEESQAPGFVRTSADGVNYSTYRANRHDWPAELTGRRMCPVLQKKVETHCRASYVGKILQHERVALRHVCDLMWLVGIGNESPNKDAQRRRIVRVIGKHLSLTRSASRISLYRPMSMNVVADLALAIGDAILEGNKELAKWVEGRFHAHLVTGGNADGFFMSMAEHGDAPFLVARYKLSLIHI